MAFFKPQSVAHITLY